MVDAHIATPRDVPQILEQVGAADFIALDTEFHPERRYLPQIYLVQVATDRGPVWLFDPLDPTCLVACARALLAKPWIVHGGAQDLRLMAQAIGAVPDEVIDVQIAAGLVDGEFPAPFGNLLQRHLGVRTDKSATLSDWSRRPLSDEQIRYAAEDVCHLHALWAVLDAALGTAARGELARALFREARDQALQPILHDLWRDIGGAQTLSPQPAGVLRSLAAWRESTARQDDLPPRVLVQDAVLLEMARRQPSKIDELYRDRRISRSLVKHHGDSMLAAIQEGARAPHPITLPRIGPMARRVAVLDTLLDVSGAQRGWSSRLVLGRSRIERWIASPPADRSSLAVDLGARDAIAGDLVWACLAGDVSVWVGPEDAILGPSGPAVRSH